MLRSRVFQLITSKRCASYLSSKFNNLANQMSPTLSGDTEHNQENQQHMVNSLDIFVRKENRQMDLLDMLVQLRKQKESTAVPLLSSILVKQLLDTSSPQELVAVLRSPVQYGVFLDRFASCYLMDHFLHNGNTLEAGQVAALLVERNLCNSELIVSLALQSFYFCLKDYKVEAVVEKKETGKPEIEKVRVKFIRNVPENDKSNATEEMVLGRALIKLANLGSIDEIKQNFALLGAALSGQTSELQTLVSSNSNIYYKETLELCQSLLKQLNATNEVLETIQQILDGCKNVNSLNATLEANLKQAVATDEPKIVAEQLQQYKEWTIEFEKAVKEQLETQDKIQRAENAQNILDELHLKRQNLWYFENKDNIDIQIFKKKVYYPKRWFGKKKKPRAVDTFYVPPEIRRND